MKMLRNNIIVLVAALALVFAVGILAGLGAARAFDNSAVTAETELLADSSFGTQVSAGREGLASLRDIIPPLLNPEGSQLMTKELSPGVYALLSGDVAVDNSGFVVGEQGVLVIDAHINHAMAQNIQDAVHRVTDKPILYLVNTNYHGDHTFGNYAFPTETQIIAHRETARRMVDFEQEKEFLLPAIDGDQDALAKMQLRLPDKLFDDFLQLDLGGQIVELYHFGHGNTPGDTVVYIPKARVAWTGNLVVGEGSIPIIFEGKTKAYLNTISLFDETLDVETIVPGHGSMTSGTILTRYQNYLGELIDSVAKAKTRGLTLEETVANLPLGERYALPPETVAAQVFGAVHRFNVSQTYLSP